VSRFIYIHVADGIREINMRYRPRTILFTQNDMPAFGLITPINNITYRNRIETHPQLNA